MWNFFKPKPIPPRVLISRLSRFGSLKAVWQNKEHDVPVVVVEYLGMSPGTTIHYVRVEGSMSGIPLNELVF